MCLGPSLLTKNYQKNTENIKKTDMFLYNNEHGHCSSFESMCINPLVKIVPNKLTIYSSPIAFENGLPFLKNYVQSLYGCWISLKTL